MSCANTANMRGDTNTFTVGSNTEPLRKCDGGVGERVPQEVAVVAGEGQPAATGVPVARTAGEAERLGPGEAVHGAVREREQRQRRGQGHYLPRGAAPLRAHGGEADAVGVRGQAAKDQAG
jgi:hypothetical protein